MVKASMPRTTVSRPMVAFTICRYSLLVRPGESFEDEAATACAAPYAYMRVTVVRDVA